MKVKREKHRAAIALPGAFFDVGGEEPPHVWGRAAACWVARRRRLRQAVRNATGGSHSYHVEAGGQREGVVGCVGSKERKPPSARKGKIRRLECEDFAPRNEATRVSGEQGAKSGRRALGGAKTGDGNVKILLPGTEAQGLAGSGEQTEKAFGPPE